MAITPRPHQLAALKDIKKGLKNKSRGQAIMACGTGKSLLAAWAVKASKARTVLVLVPSLALVRQVRESFLQVFPKLASVAVCSDKTVAGRDAVSIDPSEVGCLVTTSAVIVRTHLKLGGQRVVFCTYQSASLLAGFKFDFAIFDEAHKTAGRLDKSFGFALDNKNIAIKKRLFLTATPRVVRLPVDTEETEDVASMDDPQVYGNRLYSLPFRTAVEEKIICGYRLIISEINEDVDTEHHAALQVAIQKSMDERGVKKVFAFFRTVGQAQTFADDTAGFDPSVTVLHVNGGMSTEERKTIVSQFEKAERAVLTNARCLTEGVDVPAVDMVVFAQAKRSTIDIVQAAGRAMRNSPGKQLGYIFLPVWRNVVTEETFEAAAARESFKPVLDVLQAMSDQDALLEDVLEDIRKGGGGGGGGGGKGPVIVYEGPDLEALRRAVTHAVVEQKRPIGYWTDARMDAAAKECNSPNEFKNKYPTAYVRLCTEGKLAEFTAHFKRKKLWNKDQCAVAARQVSTWTELSQRFSGAYKMIHREHWENDLCSHFEKFVPLPKKWTMAAVSAEAAKHADRAELARKCKTAYNAALKFGMLDSLYPPRPSRSSEAEVRRVAAGCSSRYEFKQKDVVAYNAALAFGIMDELIPKNKRRPGGLLPGDFDTIVGEGTT